jgi:hypothetical protein
MTLEEAQAEMRQRQRGRKDRPNWGMPTATTRPLSIGRKAEGHCVKCDDYFEPRCNRQKYCDPCGKLDRAAKDKTYRRKRYKTKLHDERECACGTKFIPICGSQKRCDECLKLPRPDDRPGRMQELKLHGLLLRALDYPAYLAKERKRDKKYRDSGNKKAAQRKRDLLDPEAKTRRMRRQRLAVKMRNPEKFRAKKRRTKVRSTIRKRFPLAHPTNIEALTIIRTLINMEVRASGDPSLKRLNHGGR